MKKNVVNTAAFIVSMGVFLPSVCLAGHGPNASKGEGSWGVDGKALIGVYNVGSGYGDLFNKSDHELKDVTIVIGEVKDNTTYIYDTEKLDCPFKPGENWYWHAKENDDGYQVLRVYADGSELTRLGS